MDERSHNRLSRWFRSGLALVVLALALATPAAALDPTLISIGTGSKTGVYYLAGGAICGLVDARRWKTGVRCLTEPSDGSIQNLRDVRSGVRTFAIVQSDWQHQAVNGTDAFYGAGADRELRSVFSLFREHFTVVARPGAGITTLADLKGKRVSLGPPGSGGRATMSLVMQALGWTDADFAYVSDIGMPDVAHALCNQEIDAAVVIVAHPNLAVEDMISSCNSLLVPVEGPEIDRLLTASPYYYTPSVIGAGTYAGQAIGVPTFALTATLVTSSRTSPAVVYELTRTVFDNFDAFRAIHPAMADLAKIQMFSVGLTAPLHEGALRYFGEAKFR